MTRESMPFDLLIVGGGPAGLAAAIRFANLRQQYDSDFSVCVLEKGSEIGAHILSGAVLEPRALDELIPDWHQQETPITTAVTTDRFYYLSAKKAFRLPTPPSMKNHGNYIISLGNLCRWLAKQATALDVNIFPGFPAAASLFNNDGAVKGVITADMGMQKDGSQGPRYQPGIEIHAKQTLFAEGCRGSLTEDIIKHFDLRKHAQPQTYGIGLKELWRVDESVHQPGTVIHTIGWPLRQNTYGGSFLYHLDNNQVAVGFVVGLDYQNPYLSPFEEFQRFKTHPLVRHLFENGERLCYGARALNEGGLQSIPKLTFPGGALIGCGAGFLNVAKIKGTHTAMKSGMLAAEQVFADFSAHKHNTELVEYEYQLKQSWLWQELAMVRNIRPAFKYGLWPGLVYSAIDYILLRGKAPWTLSHHHDHKQLRASKHYQLIDYPKPDGKITFDRLSSVYISNTHHEENQPCHLKLNDPAVPIDFNLAMHAAPEQRYCPAGVYEITTEADGKQTLRINAQNCLHCKTCDIKDYQQNIRWLTPEGGGGPNYTSM